MLNPKRQLHPNTSRHGTVLWARARCRATTSAARNGSIGPAGAVHRREFVHALKWVVFEPNDEPLWANPPERRAFVHDLFRQGAFQGKTPQEAYFVKCDRGPRLKATSIARS